MNAFVAAIDLLFADPNLGREAWHRDGEGQFTVSDGHAPLIFAFRPVVRSSSGGFERLRAHRGVPDVLIVMPFCACA